MNRSFTPFCSLFLVFTFISMKTYAEDRQPQQSANTSSPVEFARDIQPILTKHCILCHGPDEAEAGLRLDGEEQSRMKLESGKSAITPGKPESSELLKRLTTDDPDERMPPPDEGESLSEQQIQQLKLWIAQGANYEQHWAYLPVKKPVVPSVQLKAWVRHPIDHFVLSPLEQRQLSPSEEASRTTLIKRLYYDLIGLPPTPEEVDRFLADESKDAYEQLVDRLLTSEHFGERWGRHWLDKARYADSDGYEKDRPRMNAWRYRDWVIQMINDDLPFDQFTIQQLAGDLLPSATPNQKLATAFHRQTLTNTEGGTDQEEFRVEATFDRTETTGSVWMGMTLICARCHSHKYDQIPQQEYYGLFAFFNNANEGNMQIVKSKAEETEYLKRKQKYDQQLAQLEQQYENGKAKHQSKIHAFEQEMATLLKTSAAPVTFKTLKKMTATANSNARLMEQQDGSLLLSGEVPQTDRYEIVARISAQTLTGIKLETLAHKSLPSKGPGRTPHGNFVLSQFQVFVSDDENFKTNEELAFSSAESDFSQEKFGAEGAISTKEKTGWAIAPQLGRNHHITFTLKEPLKVVDKKYLKIVLDQSYGTQHTIGLFRLSLMTGFDPLRSLPKPLAKAIRVPREKRNETQNTMIADHVLSRVPEVATIQKQLADLKKKSPASPMMNVRIIVPAERKTKLLHRGDFLQPAEEVSHGGLSVIGQVHPLKVLKQKNDRKAVPTRLDLANWLVHPDHPLTSRVTVNQIWSHLFGRGIVPTVSDFGVRGEQPTHPELLDWLAWHFSHDWKWSRKRIIKEIVMSATYRQASILRDELKKRDLTNQWFARQNRVRVQAELVRDFYLSVSGLLSRKIGGPSVFPPLPSGVAELSYANNFKWKTSTGEDRYRRGMYTFFKRTAPHPTLISFDCPDSNTTKMKRDISNTPLQALVTLNNDVFHEAAQAMAARVLYRKSTDDFSRLVYALRLCVARIPSHEDVARFHKLLNIAREYYSTHEEDAKSLTNSHRVQQIAVEENAAWIATVRMIMNLDEFIVRD